ncbi:MAG: hypothetical protein MRY21_04360 [Simkaniaceae bacterium]|nr:hypothetical protein [Simkaniaceae bacterium]
MTQLILSATDSYFGMIFDHPGIDGPSSRQEYKFRAEWLKVSPHETLSNFMETIAPYMEGEFTQIIRGAFVGRINNNESPEKEDPEYFDITQALTRLFTHHQRLIMTTGTKDTAKLCRILEGSPEDLLRLPIHSEPAYPLTRVKPYEFPLTVETLKQTELFGRVPRKELIPFLERLGDIEITRKELIEGAKSFINARLEDPIFQREDWPLVAFLAHTHGFISKNQLCQLQLLDTYLSLESTTATAVGATILTPEKLAKYGIPDVEIMDLPPLERMLFKVAFAPRRSEGEFYLASFNYTIYEPQLFKKRGRLNIISPAIIDRNHAAKFPSTVMEVNPVFGYSRRMDRWMKTEERDSHIPSRFFTNPEKAHDVSSATPFDCYWHDAVYHLYLESSNPYRVFYRDLAANLLHLNRPLNMSTALIFLDRDMSIFAKKEIREQLGIEKYAHIPSCLFWANMVQSLLHPTLEKNFDPLSFAQAMIEVKEQIPFGMEGYLAFKEIFTSLEISEMFRESHSIRFEDIIDCVFGLKELDTLVREDLSETSPSPTLPAIGSEPTD